MTEEYYLNNWKYEDNKRPIGKCYDCRISYNTFQDFIVSDIVWEKINPTYHEGAGILCPTCIVNRLHFLGLWYDYNKERYK